MYEYGTVSYSDYDGRFPTIAKASRVVVGRWRIEFWAGDDGVLCGKEGRKDRSSL